MFRLEGFNTTISLTTDGNELLIPTNNFVSSGLIAMAVGKESRADGEETELFEAVIRKTDLELLVVVNMFEPSLLMTNLYGPFELPIETLV
jgi:hypothetical protein